MGTRQEAYGGVDREPAAAGNELVHFKRERPHGSSRFHNV